MNTKSSMIISFGLLVLGNAYAKTVEYIENGYAQQAPVELVNHVEEAATYFDFKEPYEVAVPKKAGMQVNPWYKFMAYGVNPQTTRPFFSINPDWVSKLPEDQQLFLLGRGFESFKGGVIPWIVKFSPFIYSFFSIALMFLLYFALGKTRLAQQKKWLRALIAYGIVAVCNLAFMSALNTTFVQYLAVVHDDKAIARIIQKTGNKEAAIKALEYFDASIKQDSNENATFWKPFEHSFEHYVKVLKK